MRNVNFKVMYKDGVVGLTREGILHARKSLLEARYNPDNSSSFLNGIEAMLHMLEATLNEKEEEECKSTT